MSVAIHISYQEKLNTRQVPAILTFHVLFDHPKVVNIVLQYMGFLQPFRYFSYGIKCTQVAEINSSVLLFKLYLVKN